VDWYETESRIGGALDRWRYIAVLAIAFVAAAVGVWAIARDDDEGSPPSPSAPGPDSTTVFSEDATSAPPDAFGEPPSARARRAVTRTVRRYVAAISDRDGEEVCKLVPSVAELELPEQRPTCAESVSASIGYRDPRGVPVFDRASISGRPEIALSGTDARATVTVVTDFADRDEPSIEDDVIYLERGEAGWTIVKPSATLYRAIGTPDVPPQVLSPR
jgi:hypothetical protein